MSNKIVKNKKWTLMVFLVLLSAFTIFIFREDIIPDIKDVFKIKPKQYYGSTADMSQILPESKHYVVNNRGEDLIDIAAKLGINMFRITNNVSGSDNKITPPYTHDQWAKVLNKMRKKGIYADILVESNAADTNFFTAELNDYYLDFVKRYIVDADVCTFSNVLIVDIRNEPLLDQNNLEKLKSASQLVRSTCPTVKITVGAWKLGDNWHDPQGVTLLTGIVDIYAIHIYGFDKTQNNNRYPDPYLLTMTYLNEIRKYANKPILIEEFGAGNGSAITDQDTLGSEILQEAVYKGVLKATYDLKDSNILGAIAFLLYPRSNVPEGWNIAKNNGNILLPAAYTFKKYAGD